MDMGTDMATMIEIAMQHIQNKRNKAGWYE